MKNEEIENLEGEIWVDVKDWEGLYQVSNMGRVKVFGRTVIFGNNTRHTKDKILKPSKRPDGYYVVGLCRDAGRLIVNLHRLVAEHFIPNDDPINKNDVDHIDNERKDDNSIKNLRWCTRKENNNNRKQKYTYKVQKIVCVNTGEIFESLADAGRKYDLAYYNIGNCCKGYSKTVGEHPVTGEPLVWRYYKDYIKLKEEDKIKNFFMIDKIYCITTNKTFNNLEDACEYANIKDKYFIGRCCQGKTSYAGKTEDGTPLRWKYLKEYKQAN